MSSFRRFVTSVVCAALQVIAGSAAAAPGDLDTSFNSTGIVTTSFGSDWDWANSVVVQANGKIVVSGTSLQPALGGNQDFAVARYNPDGSLDLSFNSTGKVTTDFNTSEWAYGMALQNDGKILVTGTSVSDGLVLVRYNPDGGLDATFKGTGKVTTKFGTSTDVGKSIAVQNDGKIVVAGYSRSESGDYDWAVVRFLSDGDLDTSFSGDGKLTTDLGGSDSTTGVVLQSDGKILVAGYSYSDGNDFALVRYNPDGSLDNTFGTAGKVVTATGGITDAGGGVVLLGSGTILVAGTVGNPEDFCLARYNSDGSLDAGFGNAGRVITDMGGDDECHGMAVQPDGKILLSGTSRSGGNYGFALARYEPDGSLDHFHGTGKVVTAIGGGNAHGESVALQSDGSILVAGYSGSSNREDFTLVRYEGGEQNYPEIDMEQPAGTSLADGAATINFANANPGSSVPLIFTIRNAGTGPLGGLLVSKDGSNAGDFNVRALAMTTLAAGESASFAVTFSPAARGTRTAAIHIASDDADENPFDINLTGTSVGPDIVVEQPLGTNLVDGNGLISFGSTNLGISFPLTLTIRNVGADPLTGLAVTKDGSDVGDFTIGTLSASSLAAGGSRNFTVTFSPATAGTRTAAIHIASNDADENPFDINLTGIGWEGPEIVVQQPAGLDSQMGVQCL